MRRNAAASLAGLALSAALASCGAGGDEDAVRSAVSSWSSAVVRHDSRAACARLSGELRNRIERHLLGEGTAGSCNTWAARYVSPRHPASRRDVRIGSVDVDGERATVRVTAPGAVPGRVTLVKKHGEWRIDDY